MALFEEVRDILKSTLQLGERGEMLTESSVLLGGVPEFDSMAVVTVITALEESYGFVIDDDDIDAATFETVGTLADFVRSKLEA